MNIVFSYCIYGKLKKYCEGMVRNLDQISEFFPDYEIHIVAGNDVPAHYIEKYKSYPSVKLLQKEFTGTALMAHRFFPIDDPDVDIMIVRDADSRFGKRDIWCINHFLNSDFQGFTIRDNKYHMGHIMGGQWGMRKTPEITITTLYEDFMKENPHEPVYMSDMIFLKTCLYPRIVKSLIVYTNSPHRYSGEIIGDIVIPYQNNYDFCGNIYLFGIDGKEYPTHDIYGNEFKHTVVIDP